VRALTKMKVPEMIREHPLDPQQRVQSPPREEPTRNTAVGFCGSGCGGLAMLPN